MPVLWEIDLAVRRLDRWTRPLRHRTARINRPARARSVRQPFGTALIIGPWNYPLGLLLTPLVASMAAGNCTILKVSEHAPHTAAMLQSLLRSAFDPGYVAVVEGGPNRVVDLIRAGVDFVFFTGGTSSGRAVMAEAARMGTPLVLELGGKNPCIIDAGIDPCLAARRVAWGKFFNAGQTCVAPDYCLVRRDIATAFIDGLIAAIRAFYGSDPRRSASYGRIINGYHFDRLAGLAGQGRTIAGGERDRGDLYIAPTLIGDIPAGSPLLTEEIFGPLLPVVTYDTIAEAIAFINERPSPLACYCFTKSNDVAGAVERRVRAGNLCFNGTLHLMMTVGMPFGGVGPGGFGRYHGRAGFDAFSYVKSVVRKSARYEFPFMYPPYRAGPGLIGALGKFLF